MSLQTLQQKLKLERSFENRLRAYYSGILDDFTRDLRAAYVVNPVSQDREDQLQNLLQSHYQRTVDIFSSTIDLPNDIAKTDGEREVIKAALLVWILSRTQEVSRIINATAVRDMSNALKMAEKDPLLSGLQGREAQLSAVNVARNHAKRVFAQRAKGAAIEETQTPAEVAKATEAEVLSGIPPHVATPTPTRQTDSGVRITKSWKAILDNVVRPSHRDADGQTVGVNEPFTVMGESLRHPGDRSLGASGRNIFGCRCTAIYNKNQIIDHRRNAT